MKTRHVPTVLSTLFAGTNAASALLILSAATGWAQSATNYALGDIPMSAASYASSMTAVPADALEGLPTSYDARSRGTVTPAKNQGSCGSCWAFAAVGAMESHILLMSAAGTIDLSEQQQVSCNTAQYGCGGGYLSCVSFWEGRGPVSESCFPYTANSGTACAYSCAETQYRIASWHTVTPTAAAFNASCYNEGPSSWRFTVYSDFYDYWANGSPGQVYRNTGGSLAGGHAVLLIGWDDAKGAFLCKNSWGRTAGPNGDGTFWIAYGNHAHDLAFGMVNFSLVSAADPAVSAFAINSGAASTTSRTVTLNSTCLGSPTEYLASESAAFSGAAWQGYSAAPSFTLSPGAGTKTVYFKVRNASTQSALVSDTIQYAETVSLPEALDAAALTWRVGGSAQWYGQRAVVHDGVDAAQSGTVGDNQESWLETTVTGPGTLSFWWKVSSETSYDFLRVAVDGAEAGKISGETGWEQRSLVIPAGAHNLRWRYTKDMSLSRGSDAGWVDQVSFTATPPATLVYVDWRNTATNPDGTLAKPYPTVLQGVTALANGGTVQVRAGSYAYPPRLLNKRMRLESYDGRVLISASGNSVPDASAPPVGQLSPPMRQVDGSMTFHFTSLPGIRYQVLTSTNFATWEVWKDFTAEEVTAELVVPDATSEPMRFFRVITP
jgi:hypothetical protein